MPSTAREFGIQGHERVSLQLRDGHVLGARSVIPAELIGDTECRAPRNAVAQESHFHGRDAIEERARLLPVDRASAELAVDHRERLGAEQGRGDELVSIGHRQ